MIKSNTISAGYNWIEKFAQLNREFEFSFILKNYVKFDAKNTSNYSLYVSKIQEKTF
jgi:hypothetical protein